MVSPYHFSGTDDAEQQDDSYEKHQRRDDRHDGPNVGFRDFFFRAKLPFLAIGADDIPTIGSRFGLLFWLWASQFWHASILVVLFRYLKRSPDSAS